MLQNARSCWRSTISAGNTEIPGTGPTVDQIEERPMLIPFWWVVVAFILGGTSGVLGLAIFSAMPGGDELDMAKVDGIGHAH